MMMKCVQIYEQSNYYDKLTKMRLWVALEFGLKTKSTILKHLELLELAILETIWQCTNKWSLAHSKIMLPIKTRLCGVTCFLFDHGLNPFTFAAKRLISWIYDPMLQFERIVQHLIQFNGISTFVGYSMQKPVYKHTHTQTHTHTPSHTYIFFFL